MSATVAKDGLTFVMLASLSSAGLIANPTMDSYRSEAPSPSLMDRVAGVAKWVREMPRRQSVIEELSGLSDHELADIGLSRCELNSVFDQSFAAKRAACN